MRFRVSRRASSAYVWFFVVICILLCSLFLQVNDQPVKADIVTLAKQYLDVPYRYGGSTPAGFDCSGYILYLFRQLGKELPRTADQQAAVGKPVAIGKLRPGDVVFFATGDDEPDISHTGLYIGDQQFIHASATAEKIIISNLTEPYWRKTFRSARQIIP
jgi:cell wall-associated NlpC family hydrolase